MTAARGRLVIVCGLPGAGKTTYARSQRMRNGGTLLSPDDWLDALSLDLWDEARRAGVEALQWLVARELLAAGGTVLIDWGTWRREERDRLREEARALGATAELVYLDVAPEELFARIARRNREKPAITREMVYRWMASFEPPGAAELALYDGAPDARP